VRTDITAVKKPSGEQAWTTQPLTEERLARHLNGGPARGVSPIKAGESVTMVALLDFDSHKGEVNWARMSAAAQRVADALELADGAAPILFRSSGGRGIHLYLLWDEPQDARSVRVWLRRVLESCGLRSGVGGLVKGQVEIFPKQDSVPVGGNGNQFILPLAGASRALAWDELACVYADVDVVGWPSSPPVPLAPPREEASRPVVDLPTGESLWRSALDSLGNGAGGSASLDYDGWRNVIFGIHHETGGSDEGLALAHEWSKRSPKYDPEFLDNRVWPYVRSERGAVITGRSIMSIAGKQGWSEPLDGSAFSVVDDPDSESVFHDLELMGDDDDDLVGLDPGPPGGRGASGGPVGRGAADPPSEPTLAQPAAPAKRGTVPQAKHLTTDQANANRLVRLYGKRVLVAAGRWHVFDGKRWHADESDVYRYGCQLSRIITEEADEWTKKAERLTAEMVALAGASLAGATGAVTSAAADGKSTAKAVATAGELDPDKLGEMKEAVAVSEALRKWSLRSEMKATIESAIGLARKMLTVDADALDRDPMLLNCRNGTVDLRTGELRGHRAGDMITKLADVDYTGLDTDSSQWERVVAQITREDSLDPAQRVLAPFLQRWFGYCATALTREQVFVVHWGGGQNGKSTIIETITRVLGEYAGVAAPGLMASSERDSAERHPTEIAALLGLRMVTAHETNDGAVLREGFIKQATGSDRLTARFMREDFFSFNPSHKLQLLTNHKPTIKGQDVGIWRRVLLMPYLMSFGSEDKVARGEALAVADTALLDTLKGNARVLSSVLSWVVRGSVAWWNEGGLRAPAAVVSASKAYQSEQDRVGQFVRECCELAPAGVMAAVMAGGPMHGADGWARVGGEARAWSEPLTQGMGGLFPTYQAWCKEGGFHSLARGRFVEGLGRSVPGLKIAEFTEGSREAGRRKIVRVFGLRVLSE
jgi:P4 family phage/plasmid primase-like protien